MILKARFNFAILMILWLTIGCDSKPQNAQKKITFKVIPKVMPDSSEIYIAGNHPTLGNWDAGAVVMSQQPDSSWMKTIAFPHHTKLEYKITRGSWRTEAVNADGVVPDNMSHTVIGDDTITIVVENWKDVAHRPVGRITGTVKYHYKLEAEGVKPRDVIVWLPPSYDASLEKHYPVLYLHDGQNVFDPSTSFLGVDWQVDEVADSLIKAGAMEEIIIVGIYNTGDRVKEYSDTEAGRAYMNFIIDHLKPLIDSTYRTLPEREHSATMGSSMGGLISFLLVWQHSEVFSMAGCLSPAFIPPYDTAIELVNDYDGTTKNILIYMDNGGVGLDAKLEAGCNAMLAALQKKGFQLGRNLEWFLDAQADHNEQAWAARVWRPLLFMFGKD